MAELMNEWVDGWMDGCKREEDVKRSERHRMAKLQHRLSITSLLFLEVKLHQYKYI